jgi:SCP-2 sterol transfer family protein
MRVEAEAYLETVLPALLRASRLAAPKAEVIIQLVVADVDGCDWFYRIADDAVEAHRGISDRVDLTVSFLSRDLADLSESKLDVKRAVRAARLQVHGDEEVLAWLSKRLAV